MNGLKRLRIYRTGGARAAAAVILLASLAACGASDILGSRPETNAAPPPAPAPPPPPPAPPPVDLAGRWQLAAAAGGACFMNFGRAPGAPAAASAAEDGAETAAPVQGTIAPEGGCPGNFFTSRKWSFENGMLIIRDFKSRPLAQLSYSGGHFEGHDAAGSALTLSKQP